VKWHENEPLRWLLTCLMVGALCFFAGYLSGQGIPTAGMVVSDIQNHGVFEYEGTAFACYSLESD